jgi:hypothetical protein
MERGLNSQNEAAVNECLLYCNLAESNLAESNGMTPSKLALSVLVLPP